MFETSELVACSWCSWIFAPSSVTRHLLDSRWTRSAAVEWRHRHRPSALSNARTAPDVTFAPLAPRPQFTVDGCNNETTTIIIIIIIIISG